MARLNDLQILVTADEGYRAFERAVCTAHSRVDMGFRVFDARTPLLSDEGKAFGETWVDLLLAKLNEGVDISVRISDFDPVVRPLMHADSYKSVSVLMGVAEMVTGSGRLRASVEAHPARVGWVPRIALWPKVQSMISQTCDMLNDMSDCERGDALRFMPRLSEFTYEEDGKVHPQRRECPSMMPVTHHQKVAVIDDETLYIGGLDLNDRRFDTKDHDRAPEETWHDVHVLVKDSARAKEARAHLERFREECTGEMKVEPPKGLLRTLSAKRPQNDTALSPVVCDTGILDRTLELIEQSEALIYLENQFLRDPVIADALCAQAEKKPKLGLITLLPASPLEVAFEEQFGLDHQYGEYLQAKFMNQVTSAFGDRFFAASPAKPVSSSDKGRASLHGAPMIFVHSKVSIFDDNAGLVSSANLNGRSMRWDTELGIEIDDTEQVASLRAQVMRAWLPQSFGREYWASQPETVGLWRKLANDNAAVVPSKRKGFVLPYEISHAEDFGTNLPGIPVEMV